MAKVNDDSPAQKADLQQGDVIIKIDGKSVNAPKAIQDVIKSHKVGDKLTFLVIRSGKLTPIDIVVGEYPEQNQK